MYYSKKNFKCFITLLFVLKKCDRKRLESILKSFLFLYIKKEEEEVILVCVSQNQRDI